MTGRKPLDVPAETLAKIRDLFMAGEGERAIARAVGLGHGVVRRRLAPIIAELKAAGAMPPPAKSGPKSRVTPDLHAQMVAMLDANTSLKQIARTVGLGEATVADYLKPELEQRRAAGKDWWRAPKAVEKRRQIVAAINRGDSYEEIGRQYGLSGVGVRQYLRHLTADQLRERTRVARYSASRASGRGSTAKFAPVLPTRDAVYRKLSAAMPRWLSPASRDDAISDAYLAVLEGRLAEQDIAAEAKRFANRAVKQWESRFGPRSLDEKLFDDGDVTLGDTLVDPAALDAFDYIFEEAR